MHSTLKGSGTHQPSKCPPRDQQMDSNILLLPQIPAQMLRQRLHGSFTRIVGWVARRVGDALLAACNYNGGGAAARGSFLEGGDIGVEAVYYAVEICVEDLRGELLARF